MQTYGCLCLYEMSPSEVPEMGFSNVYLSDSSLLENHLV